MSSGPFRCYGRLAQLVEHALDVRRVSGSSPLSSTTGFSRNYFREISFLMKKDGRLAQLVEHALDVRRVSGSSPLSSTTQEKSEPVPNWERVRIFLFLRLSGFTSGLCNWKLAVCRGALGYRCHFIRESAYCPSPEPDIVPPDPGPLPQWSRRILTPGCASRRRKWPQCPSSLPHHIARNR